MTSLSLEPKTLHLQTHRKCRRYQTIRQQKTNKGNASQNVKSIFCLLFTLSFPFDYAIFVSKKCFGLKTYCWSQNP